MNLDLLPEEIRSLAKEYRSSPHFLMAVNHFIKSYLDNFKGNFVLNHLSSNELSNLILAYLFYLHYWRDKHDPTSGVTLSRVQAFCAERGLAGQRRIATLFGVVQSVGYFKRELTDVDERVKVLRPTLKAYAVLRGIVNSYIEAIEIIEQTGHYKDYINSDPQAAVAIISHGFEILYLNGIALRRSSIRRTCIETSTRYATRVLMPCPRYTGYPEHRREESWRGQRIMIN